MEIKKEDIVRLRKTSGQPIMDCKKALQETNSFDESFEYLRKNATEKIDYRRKDKVVSEGRVVIKGSHEFPIYGSNLAMVSLLCETDFTSKSDVFIDALDKIADLTLTHTEDDWDEIDNIVDEVKAQTGEKVELGQTYMYMNIPENTSIGTYTHFDNKKAAIVTFNARSNPVGLQELGKNIAMHVVASKPLYPTVAEYSKFPIANKKNITIPEGIDKKPPEIQVKIMDGVYRKHKKETVLLEQPYCLNDKISVDEAIKQLRRDEMMEIELIRFNHIEIGD